MHSFQNLSSNPPYTNRMLHGPLACLVYWSRALLFVVHLSIEASRKLTTIRLAGGLSLAASRLHACQMNSVRAARFGSLTVMLRALARCTFPLFSLPGRATWRA